MANTRYEIFVQENRLRDQLKTRMLPCHRGKLNSTRQSAAGSLLRFRAVSESCRMAGFFPSIVEYLPFNHIWGDATMAKLYFRYGAMGSSKTANAIMVQYNYQERGQNALMLKPRLDNRDGARMVGSRSGLSAPCAYVEDLDGIDLSAYDCVIVDECQFLKKAQVERLVHIVDDMNIPVICYGLRADFQGNLFEGSMWLMAWADTIEEIKTVCWCGRKATFNARVSGGRVVKAGEQILLGGNESYVALCRRHWARGELAPMEVRRIASGKRAYMDLLLEADPSERMIERYLDAGEMYLLMKSGMAVCEAVLLRGADGVELCSLATRPDARGKGCATSLLNRLIQMCRGQTARMFLGTSPGNVAFYRRFGFEPYGVREGFFTEHYDPPIEEDGAVLRDMILMEKKL